MNKPCVGCPATQQLCIFTELIESNIQVARQSDTETWELAPEINEITSLLQDPNNGYDPGIIASVEQDMEIVIAHTTRAAKIGFQVIKGYGAALAGAEKIACPAVPNTGESVCQPLAYLIAGVEVTNTQIADIE